jgi:hypothetical protein
MVEADAQRLRSVVQDAVHVAVANGHLPDDERRVLDALLQDPDDARVMRRLRRRRRHGDPLGFGIETTIAVAVAPLLMIVVEEVVRTVTGTAAESLTSRFVAWLRRVLRRPRPVVHVPVLTSDQLRVVHDQVLAKLLEAQVPEPAARALAERVAGSLAIGAQGAGPDGPPDT